MLTKEQIKENKEKFILRLQSTKRKGIEDLIEYLESTDFFTAPASTVYHNNFEGGLCAHSLNVYLNICKLVNLCELDIPYDSLIISALLHDISKADYYEEYVQNVKYYNNYGKQSDNVGRFDWVGVKKYKVKDVELRNVGGEHGFNSYFQRSSFIELSPAEAFAIVNHHMGAGEPRMPADISEIYDRYPLASLLHMADLMSTYITENKYLNEQANKGPTD